jgi:uncharacterized protein with HEPN domain
MRSDGERLLDILEAIEMIEARMPDNRLAFDQNDLLHIWFVHYLQIIGEAASRVSDELRQKNPQIPWEQMIGMRHILVHGYFEVDLDIVWSVVEKDLQDLKEQVQALLQNQTGE